MNALPARSLTITDTEPAPPTPSGLPPPLGPLRTPPEAPASELVEYLWGSSQPPPLLYRARGYALALAKRPATPGSAQAAPEEPAPLGLVHLYPRFMVFVANRGGGGARRTHPSTTLLPIGTGAFARLADSERARLTAPLRAPGTLILPLAEVTDVRSERRGGLPCIELTTRSRTIRLGGQAAISVPATRWEPRLYQLLVRLGPAR